MAERWIKKPVEPTEMLTLVSITTLNQSGIKTSIKRQKFSDCILKKQYSNIYCLGKNFFNYKDKILEYYMLYLQKLYSLNFYVEVYDPSKCNFCVYCDMGLIFFIC